MDDERGTELLDRAVALEHQTGPSRGTVTWLSGSTLDISLGSNRLIRISEARPGEPRDDLIARLHRVEDTYKIEDIMGRSIRVNGGTVTAQNLMHGDMIEFGETGPLSRFRLCREDQPLRITVGDILSDGLAYLRFSRRPIFNRMFRACEGCSRRLMLETTVLFRVSVILAFVVLAAVSYQQNQLNSLLQQRIEKGATRLDSFAGALARAR